MGRNLDAAIVVGACLRDGVGGSPTAVVHGDGDGDAALARIPVQAGTSHVAVIYPRVGATDSQRLRFFTSTGELPGCGHGTVAALAVLAARNDGFNGPLRMGGQDLGATSRVISSGVAAGTGEGSLVEAWFDQGTVAHRAVSGDERQAFLGALGLNRSDLHPDDEVVVTSPGRERLLVPVANRAVLAGIRPDQDRLAAESRRFGQLGCFVYVPPSTTERVAARMFAPAIGVPEDVANANSAGCLAAHLLATGRVPTIAVDQGDVLGRPSTVHATASRAAGCVVTRVGGIARVPASTASSVP